MHVGGLPPVVCAKWHELLAAAGLGRGEYVPAASALTRHIAALWKARRWREAVEGGREEKNESEAEA